MRVILLGAPGSGKGTQGDRIAAHYNVLHISSGQLIRDQIRSGTEFGRKVAAVIDAGNFVSDDEITYLMERRVAEPDAGRGYVLDGFPRDVEQAEAFDESHERGGPLTGVLELCVDQAVIVRRLAARMTCPVCGTVYNTDFNPPQRPGVCDRDGQSLTRRPDDDPAAIANRFEVYDRLTLPLRDYYAAQRLLIQVDASGSPDEVLANAIAALDARLAAPARV